MLTEKDYCDYETCVALRELGCRIETEWYIHQPSYERGSCYLCFGIPRETSVLDECDYIPRLSLYEAQKWLREEWGVHITIHYVYHLNEHVFGGTLRFMGKALRDSGVLYDTTKYSTYEEALLERIKGAIELLKEEK
jgi:hypothetical protein